jgi:hypothetical protein
MKRERFCDDLAGESSEPFFECAMRMDTILEPRSCSALKNSLNNPIYHNLYT